MTQEKEGPDEPEQKMQGSRVLQRTVRVPAPPRPILPLRVRVLLRILGSDVETRFGRALVLLVAGVPKDSPEAAQILPPITNRIRTTKYTPITFVPRVLIEQLSRVANIFFLLVVVLQCIPDTSSSSPFMAAAPVVTIVGLSILKDAIEDRRRLLADRALNQTITYRLDRTTKTWAPVPWADIKTGDIVRINSNEPVPADMLLLHSSDDCGIAYIETKSLDGETSLKLRRAALIMDALKMSTEAESTSEMAETLEPDQLELSQNSNTAYSPAGSPSKNRTSQLETVSDDNDPPFSAHEPISPNRIGNAGHIPKFKTASLPRPTTIERPQLQPRSDSDPEHFSPKRKHTGVRTSTLADHAPNLPKIQTENRFDKYVSSWADLSLEIVTEPPNPTLSVFNGVLKVLSAPLMLNKNSGSPTSPKQFNAASPTEEESKQGAVRAEPELPDMKPAEVAPKVEENIIASGPSSLPISIDNVVLRGCFLRNTDTVIGVVMFTGCESKILLNSGPTPSKLSRIDRMINPQVAANFALLFIICIVCAAASNSLRDHYNVQGYPDPPSSYTNVNLSSSGHQENIPLSVFITFLAAIVIFQNIVPISLYISVEFVKAVQAYFIYADHDMLYQGKKCTPRRFNISDDLGLIEYVFSDKTGTLTRNIMEFRHCFCAGREFLGTDKHEFKVLQRSICFNKHISDNPHFVDADLLRYLRSHPLPQFLLQNTTLSRRGFSAKQHLLAGSVHISHAERNDNDPMDEQSFLSAMHFWIMLSVCHTVVVADKFARIPTYNAQSPDEGALVSTARDMGFVFHRRELDRLSISVLGSKITVELLHVIEFNSTRKRMSVVVRFPSGAVFLYTKGADNVIMARLKECKSSQSQTEQTALLESLHAFAEGGLRTLVLAYREMSPAEYAEFNTRYTEAMSAVSNRDEAVSKVAEEYEKDYVLAGATAIEDRLQSGVPEAISLLSRAGVHIWMLTGDKVETAINIASSCNLLGKQVPLFLISGTTGIETQLANALNSEELAPYKIQADFSKEKQNGIWRYFAKVFGARHKKFALAKRSSTMNVGPHPVLVVDGEALAVALCEPHRAKFLQLCLSCHHVLCCRSSPLQKSQVVALVRQTLGAVTLSIGDGANDVGMLQEADIGVGIAGEEGMQAVMASDYAIGQFRYLVKLVLLHGRWSQIRTSGCVVNFFYKNIVWVFVMFWYQFFAGFSAVLLFDYTYVMLYNLIFTVLPVLVLGCLDQDVPMSATLMFPESYPDARALHTTQRFLFFVLDAVYQSLIVYFVPHLAFSEASTNSRGMGPTLSEVSTCIALAGVFVVNIFVGINMWSINIISAVGLGLCALSLFVYAPLYSFISLSSIYKSANLLYGEPAVYLCVVLISVLCFLPRFLIEKYYMQNYCHNDSQIVREIMREKNYSIKKTEPAAATQASKGNAATALGGEQPDKGLSELTSEWSLLGPVVRMFRDHGEPTPRSDQAAAAAAGRNTTPTPSVSLNSSEISNSLATSNQRVSAAGLTSSRSSTSSIQRASRVYDMSTGQRVTVSGYAFSQSRGMVPSVVTSATIGRPSSLSSSSRYPGALSQQRTRDRDSQNINSPSEMPDSDYQRHCAR